MTDGISTGQIRAKVICIFRDGTRILVGDAFDPAKNELFYCPPGGGIKFGESSEEALRREIREELETEIENPWLLGVLENIFTYDGKRGHEIVFVYDAQFVKRSLYNVDQFTGCESNGEFFNASWLDIDSIGPQTPPVYPDGLLDLLKKELA
ncbi:MAG: NUDIX hydrolase [Chloroflexota bacterium]